MPGRFFYPSYAGAHHSARRIQRERIDPRPAHPGSVGAASARLAGRSTQVVVFAAGPTAALEWFFAEVILERPGETRSSSKTRLIMTDPGGHIDGPC